LILFLPSLIRQEISISEPKWGAGRFTKVLAKSAEDARKTEDGFRTQNVGAAENSTQTPQDELKK
jgi:hypothetical protein